ncbi:hypothetical protein BLFGPEAP_01122 [Candidatus Methanoperedenaceae archaeon GB50]|nr:hypothetical protein BLFGPEAP_01122 [Candidatus Methanoperedenaceae archaeon GB50]
MVVGCGNVQVQPIEVEQGFCGNSFCYKAQAAQSMVEETVFQRKMTVVVLE